MKTAEDFYQKKVSEVEPYPYTEFHLKRKYAIEAMEEYAQYKVNELNKSDVIKSVCEHDIRNYKDRQECDKCGEVWIRQ